MAKTQPGTGVLRAIGLADNRMLSYAEYGSPTGTPVLFFHGFPASHKEATFWHECAMRNSVRLVAPDRPGIGMSSYQPSRRVIDWPTDVLELTTLLNLDSCHILAISGGSPYALACLLDSTLSNSNKSSATRLNIRGSAIVSGIYPMDLGASGMQLSTRIVLWILGYCWFLLIPLLDWFMGKPARNNPTLFASRLLKEGQSRPIPDKTCLSDETYRQRFVESTRHAFACESRGVAHEAGLMGRRWGFELKDISKANAETISIWHGGFDEACPAEMARKAHENLEGSMLRVMEYEGGLSLPTRHQDKILKELLANN